MSENIGTLYITQIPALTDSADIQSAFKLYHYGTTSTPTDPANLIANSVAGNLRRFDTTAVFLAGTQTITGAKTFSAALTASSTLTVTGTMTTNGNTVIGSDNTDTLTVNAVSTFAGNSTFSGTLTANGNVTIGNASTDTVTVSSDTWTFSNVTNFIVPNTSQGITFKTAAGSGLSIGGLDAAGNPALITPWYGNTALTSSQLYYNSVTDQWVVENNARVSKDFIVYGTTTINANTTIGATSSNTLTINSTTNFTSPTSFSTDVTVPTQTVGDSSTKVATTQFVASEITNMFSVMCFGNGQDGSYTLSSSQAAVSGLFTKPYASTGFVLQRDAYFQNLTIASGTTLDPNGYTIYVAGTLTMNGANAFAHAASPGGNGSSGSSGSGISFTTQGYQTVTASTSGGSGGTTSGSAGTAGGAAATPTASSLFAATYSQAVGGAGGISVVSGFYGGSGGTIYSPAGAGKEWRTGLINFLSRLWANPSGYIMNASGTGGGGGGGGAGQNGSGGGGGGQANTGIVLFANKIVTSGANEFYFVGASGGAGGNAISNSVGAGGGGGGGQGGFVYIVTNGVSGNFSGSAINVSGGNGGAAGTNGSGSPVALAGRGGSSGTVVITRLDKATTTIYLPVSATGQTGSVYSYPILA